MYFILGYLGLGVVVGFLSGLFGIGGGVILVPFIAFALETIGAAPEHLMHIAIGTSLSCIFINSLNSVVTHLKNNNLDFLTFKKLIIGIIPGTILGGLIADYMSSRTLEVIFAIFLTFVLLNMLAKTLRKSEYKKRFIPNYVYAFVGLLIGLKSAILGVGGGTISIPFLTFSGEKMKRAVGISSLIGLPISAFGMLTYILNGYGNSLLPEYALGYVFVPAFLGIASTSWYFARLGASVSHRVPHEKLTRLFLIFLFLLILKTYYKLFF